MAVYVLPLPSVFGQDVPPVLLVAWATAVGVLIDLDHFLIARLETGTWDALRFCLENPSAAFLDQDRIFNRGDVGALSRLLSHLVIAGVLVGTLTLVNISLAVLTATVLYAHLVCDVAWDVVRFRREAATVRQLAD